MRQSEHDGDPTVSYMSRNVHEVFWDKFICIITTCKIVNNNLLNLPQWKVYSNNLENSRQRLMLFFPIYMSGITSGSRICSARGNSGRLREKVGPQTGYLPLVSSYKLLVGFTWDSHSTGVLADNLTFLAFF